MTAVLAVAPLAMEVAAAWLPPGTSLVRDGQVILKPDPELGWYCEAGWDRVSGGCVIVSYMSWQGLRNGKRPASRPAWDEAARVLRRAARDGSGPAVVYVRIEQQEKYGRAVLVAAGTRTEE